MKQLFIFLVMMLLWIPLNAQTLAQNSNDEGLTTVKTETDDYQDNSVDDLPWHNRRFKVTAGGFFPVNNTQVKVEGNNGNIGTEIDLESDLGFSKSTASFLGTFDWRISKRSRLGFEYFVLDRTATKTLQRDINFGDHTYPVDGSVRGTFNVQIARIAYGYAILSKPKYQAGLLIGAHVLFADLGLKLNANTQSVEYRDTFNFTAPLPDIGIWGEFVLGKRWGLYANVNYLAVKINDTDGRIISYNLAVLYNVVQNFSLTAGYTGLNFRIDTIQDRLNGFLKWGYNGPTITAVYTFGKHVKVTK
ncbi:hypothetical protein NU08_2814 [Flavobacterium anhuiense]|uniref:Outer membrane protein beta-barrel domain-containing protein n=1 Tax=Flavobacterium anhuiense TaxID=459526 RepID=A0A444VX92_9FLAO|nr:hypothetical protein [Flavobacterium anhuiense]RYJ38199.1 hypothetical protein NU08_2814 [Flavobacterium anhuiense]